MPAPTTDPICEEWPTSDTPQVTAREVNARLATREVDELDGSILPFLAASGAELASLTGIAWRFSPDDPAVALLRLISRVAITNPGAAGPHTTRLARRLDDTDCRAVRRGGPTSRRGSRRRGSTSSRTTQ
ncbi:MAG: hypothetical protein AAFY28_08925 [Actinomycetota bacterium]